LLDARVLLRGTAPVDEPLVADRMFVDDGIDELIEGCVNVHELEAGRRQEVLPMSVRKLGRNQVEEEDL